MELKFSTRFDTFSGPLKPLIEPYGIEIKMMPEASSWFSSPLIEPYGIEIAFPVNCFSPTILL